MGMVKVDILDLSITKVPMLKPLLALVLGIFLGHKIAVLPFYLLPYCLIISFMVLVLSQVKRLVVYRKPIFSVSYYFLMFFVGLWIIAVHNPKYNLRHFSHYSATQLIGIIDDEPILKTNTIRFPVRITSRIDSQGSAPVEGRVMVTLLKDTLTSQSLHYGDLIVFKNAIHDAVAPLNPKEFDYKAYLSTKGIGHQCFLTAADYKIIGSNKGNFILKRSLHIRQVLIDKFAIYMHKPEAFQIAVALLFGYRSELEATTKEAFTKTGTIHILSVSGLHVSLVFGVLSLLLRWLDRFKHGKMMRCRIVLLVVWVYVILTGMSPAILRAGIMISFFIVSLLSGRRQVAVNTLLTSALFILLLAPQYLFTVGFQLSYAAILGILLLYPLLTKLWLPNNKGLKRIVQYSYVSIAAQIFTLPLTLHYFGQFPIYFLIANLFIGIPSVVVMYLGILLTFSPLDGLSKLGGYLLELILTFCVDVLRFISQLPLSTYSGIQWDTFQLILLYIVFIFLLIASNYRDKRLFYVSLVILLPLNVYTVVKNFAYATYVGCRIYNVRSAIAIATIEQGNVFLFSTLDSLRHPTIQFSVLPDLLRFADEDKIVFVHLKNEQRSNYSIKVGWCSFLILERELYNDMFFAYDFILWRKDNLNNLLDFRRKYEKSIIIIDGSNSQRNINILMATEANMPFLYLLKNNFAYVWVQE